jgi:hypothetical protein
MIVYIKLSMIWNFTVVVINNSISKLAMYTVFTPRITSVSSLYYHDMFRPSWAIISISQDTTLWSPQKINRHFGRTFCLYLQCGRNQICRFFLASWTMEATCSCKCCLMFKRLHCSLYADDMTIKSNSISVLLLSPSIPLPRYYLE